SGVPWQSGVRPRSAAPQHGAGLPRSGTRARHSRVSSETAADARPLPFVDLKRAEDRIRDELREAYERVTAAALYILGPDVAAFEEESAAPCATAHAIAPSDGTESLRLALLALGAGPGREVVAPAMTYIATI